MKTWLRKHSKKLIGVLVTTVLVVYLHVPVTIATAVGDAMGTAVEAAATAEPAEPAAQ